MNISFAVLGVEECETCDEFKIHIAEYRRNNDFDEESGDVAELVRKKKRKTYATDQPTRCKNVCKICDTYEQHYSEKIFTRNDYENEKKLNTATTINLSADLQKVVLLPRLPGYKKSIFTTRLIAFNMTFAPIGLKKKQHTTNGIGHLWHEEINGRKYENIVSCYYSLLNSVHYRDFENFVIWVDNCGGQNECWTL